MTAHECPLEAFYRQDELGNWVPCYVRGYGETKELAELHGQMVRAQLRLEIAISLHRKEASPYRLFRAVEGRNG